MSSEHEGAFSSDDASEESPDDIDSDEDIDEWVKEDSQWDSLTNWQEFLLASRQSYFIDRQQILGPEYHAKSKEWDAIFEREWAIVEERMNAGIGVDTSVLALYDLDFFKDKSKLMAEIESTMDNEHLDVGYGKPLQVYSFEDFIMLSNQGIFRDSIFLIDPQRKWRKKVEEILSQYGYNNVEWMAVRGENYLVVTK